MFDRDFGTVLDTFLDDLNAPVAQVELTSCRETATDPDCKGPCVGKPTPKPKPKHARFVGSRTSAALRREVERAILVKTK